MEKWQGKVAIVTGASAGIGAAIAKALVQKGVLVAGLARRIDRIEELSRTLSMEEAPGKLYGLKCDITKEEDILKSFKWITENVGPVHILVNNAGLIKPTSLTEGATQDWRKVFDVNVMALCICTREALKIMRKNKIDGHIIHINNIGGHVIPCIPKDESLMNVYPASKFAVTALTESLRQELKILKSKTKVTSISPGMVITSEFQKNLGSAASLYYKDGPTIKPSDVAEAVIYSLSTGENVQVQDLIIRPFGDT
ncbi:farnesol dehydrogenase-like [Coccinella septempunctata]|uniref:farnesol dehydrogenase-like n=1 Tax=Coccinella septempunctata TaxID=41139 RepID=UPI001D05D854|nr:farnesol dehydrogenase-like [Coccinella septempunctata]